MFRVKLNLWADLASAKTAAVDEPVEAHGDWTDEQERVDACMTREELCRTFQEKFPTQFGPETKNTA